MKIPASIHIYDLGVYGGSSDKIPPARPTSLYIWVYGLSQIDDIGDE